MKNQDYRTIKEVVRKIGHRKAENGKTNMENMVERLFERASEGDLDCFRFLVKYLPSTDWELRD